MYNGGRGGPSYSAYMTFSNPRDSAIAILVSTISDKQNQFTYSENIKINFILIFSLFIKLIVC